MKHPSFQTPGWLQDGCGGHQEAVLALLEVGGWRLEAGGCILECSAFQCWQSRRSRPADGVAAGDGGQGGRQEGGGDPAWGGMELVAALVCTPGHLVTYIHGGQNQHGNW